MAKSASALTIKPIIKPFWRKKKCNAFDCPNLATYAKFHCYLAVALALAASNANATIIGISYKADWIVVAADSRATDTRGNPTDGHCKIFRVDETHFSAILGRVFYKGASAADVATKIGAEASRFSVHEMAEKWTSAFKDALEIGAGANKEDLIEGLVTDNVTLAYWGGSDINQQLALTLGKITYSKSTTGIVLHTSANDLPLPSEKSLVTFDGEAAINSPLDEFWNSQTSDRAITAKQSFVSQLQFDPNGYPANAESAAKLLKFALETAIPWAKTNRVGGKISVLIAEKGRPIRWLAPCER
jgi:hypothetical protein